MATGKANSFAKELDNNNIKDAVELTSFQNSWQTNGLCFWKRTGDMVTLHIAIRNGTTTSGTRILYLPTFAPSATVIAPVFNLSGQVLNGYLSIATTGAITIHNLTTANIWCEVSWLVT